MHNIYGVNGNFSRLLICIEIQ